MQDDERIVDKRAASRMNDDEGPAAKPVDERSSDTNGPASADDALAAARAEAETNLRNWQRSAADFANFKRRMDQEKAETARIYNASLAINLLPIFDDLDRAVSTVDAHLAGLNWVQGVTAIHRKFANLLQAMQIVEIVSDGESFDPARHEAVGQQPGPEGKVVAVVQKGYQINDRVIRPAMVLVGSGEPTA